MDSRLFCLLRLPDELHVEPSRDLVFEGYFLCFYVLTQLGPFVRPVTSIVKLTNPSSQFVCFKISASSPDHFFATPSTGVMYPHENLEVSGMIHFFVTILYSCVSSRWFRLYSKKSWENVNSICRFCGRSRSQKRSNSRFILKKLRQ